MLSELVFEQIEGNFWYAAYGPFRVIMMKDTGYINASKMCMDGDKHFHHWKENKSSQALIHSVEKMLAIEAQTIQICDPGIGKFSMQKHYNSKSKCCGYVNFWYILPS